VLCAILVSPIFDIVHLLSFTDNSYDVKSNPAINNMVNDMEKFIKVIAKLLEKSELKVKRD
jgi:hypothetical protein